MRLIWHLNVDIAPPGSFIWEEEKDQSNTLHSAQEMKLSDFTAVISCVIICCGIIMMLYYSK